MKNIITMSVIALMLNGCSDERPEKYRWADNNYIIANEMIKLNKNMERLIEIMERK